MRLTLKHNPQEEREHCQDLQHLSLCGAASNNKQTTATDG